MKRKILTFILALAMLVSCTACAKDEENTNTYSTTTSALPDSSKVEVVADESFVYQIYKDYAEITSYIGGGAVVNVPTNYDGVTVMSIGASAFYGNTTITRVVLPDCVVNIANKAFAKCINLTEIVMDGVKAIGMESFKGCGFTQISIPPILENLGKYAFSESKLTSCVLPASIVRAGDYIFAGCENITEVTFPATMTEITARMFYNCSSLTEVTVPDQITEIGEYAYSSCANLTKLIVHKNVTEIGEGILYNSPNAVLYVEKGSYAESYAKDHNVTFEYIK